MCLGITIFSSSFSYCVYMDNSHGALFSAQICYPKLQAFNLLIGSTPDSACACGLCHFSRVWLFAIPWTVTHHAPLLCLTLCNPMDCSPPRSSVHGILQAGILECVAMPSSKGSSWPRDWAHVSCISYIAGGFFSHWATWAAHPWLRK